MIPYLDLGAAFAGGVVSGIAVGWYADHHANKWFLDAMKKGMDAGIKLHIIEEAIKQEPNDGKAMEVIREVLRLPKN